MKYVNLIFKTVFLIFITYLSIYLYLSLLLSIYLSIYLSNSLQYLSIYLSICLSLPRYVLIGFFGFVFFTNFLLSFHKTMNVWFKLAQKLSKVFSTKCWWFSMLKLKCFLVLNSEELCILVEIFMLKILIHIFMQKILECI